MDTPPQLVPLLIVGNLVFFVVMWVGVLALISVLSGWGTLARQYPMPPNAGASPAAGTFSLVSAFLNRSRYSGCLKVTVGPEGLGLSVLGLFRMNHPPLLIPWNAIEDLRAEDNRARFKIRTGERPVSVDLRGVRGDLLAGAWQGGGYSSVPTATPYPPPSVIR
jgi:hypothetical protein